MCRNLLPKFTPSAQYLSSSARERTLILSMNVWRSFSFTRAWALLASSARTKLSDSVLFTTRRPASRAARSSVAQYLPSRYSRTKTGTFAPTLILRTRSLRTTLPAKISAALRSRGSVMILKGEFHRDVKFLGEFELGLAIQHTDRDCADRLRGAQHKGQSVGQATLQEHFASALFV